MPWHSFKTVEPHRTPDQWSALREDAWSYLGSRLLPKPARRLYETYQSYRDPFTMVGPRRTKYRGGFHYAKRAKATRLKYVFNRLRRHAASRRGRASSISHARAIGAGQAPAGTMVSGRRGVRHHAPMPGRGALVKLNPMKERILKPEMTIIETPVFFAHAQPTRYGYNDGVPGNVDVAWALELGPHLWGRMPVKGAGRGDRLKNSFNVHGMSMKFRTLAFGPRTRVRDPNNALWDTEYAQFVQQRHNFRIVIAQIFDAQSHVREDSQITPAVYPWSKETAPGSGVWVPNALNPLANPYDIYQMDLPATYVGRPANVGNASMKPVKWTDLFQTCDVSSPLRSRRASQTLPFNNPDDNARLVKYKILFDKVYPWADGEHEGEIKFGKTVIELNDNQNSPYSIPTVHGRMVMFVVTDPALSLMQPLGIREISEAQAVRNWAVLNPDVFAENTPAIYSGNRVPGLAFSMKFAYSDE